MRYYYKQKSEGIISEICMARTIPDSGIELTKEQYENYIVTLRTVPEKPGYEKNITLYVDGNYEVTYVVQISEESDSDTENGEMK